MKLSVAITKRQLLLGLLLWGCELMVFPVSFKLLNRAMDYSITLSALNTIVFALNLGLTLLIFHSFLRSNLWNALQQTGRLMGSFGFGLLICFGGAVIINLLITALVPDFVNVNDRAIKQLSAESYPLMLLSTVILVPTAEETIYRGLLFAPLYRKNKVLAYIVSMCAFSIIHLINHIGDTDFLTLGLCFLQYLPAGFSLAWAYTRADSIFAPILIHTQINLIGMLVMPMDQLR